MDWDERYRKGEIHWDKGAPSPPLQQYLDRHPVKGRALVPGCGHGHEVALAVEHGLNATGLDIAPTAIAEAQALYPQLARHFVTGDFFNPPDEAALRLDPNSAETHENFGSALADLPGRLPEALAQFQEAVRLDPSVAGDHYNLALALMSFPGRAPEAVTHYEEALRLKPNYAEAHYNLGNALAAMPSRLPEALAHYEAALRINPANAQVQNNAAVLYARSGRFAEAAAHWETALQLNPSLSEVRENLKALRASGK